MKRMARVISPPSLHAACTKHCLFGICIAKNRAGSASAARVGKWMLANVRSNGDGVPLILE